MSIVGAFPNTIKNGDAEDATVVMALFAYIQSQINSNACPATVGASILKGNGSGGTSNAVAGTDYVQPSAFGNSKATNGYQNLQGGVILQWGSAVSSASAGVVVTFPTPFIVQASAIVITPIAAQGSAVLDNGSLPNFTFSLYNPASSRIAASVNWFAIGY